MTDDDPVRYSAAMPLHVVRRRAGPVTVCTRSYYPFVTAAGAVQIPGVKFNQTASAQSLFAPHNASLPMPMCVWCGPHDAAPRYQATYFRRFLFVLDETH